MRFPRLSIIAAAACLCWAGAAATPRAEQLKADFLDCERQGSAGLLDGGTAGQCSVVYEELKRRVFDGDFGRLLAWWRSQQAARRASSGPGGGNELRPAGISGR